MMLGMAPPRTTAELGLMAARHDSKTQSARDECSTAGVKIGSAAFLDAIQAEWFFTTATLHHQCQSHYGCTKCWLWVLCVTSSCCKS